jgi:hypothetical protein
MKRTRAFAAPASFRDDADRRNSTMEVAERVGFEPTVPLLAAHTISSRVPSANSDISPHISHVVENALSNLSPGKTAPRHSGRRVGTEAISPAINKKIQHLTQRRITGRRI